jgi:tRNA-uridine 2-sulfurtransferase
MQSKGKVLVAMSGGVDSSVAAALLLREGFEVVGCFMRLGSPGETLDELRLDDPTCATATNPKSDGRTLKIGHQGCCSINDAADARAVAAELGIPLYVCNFKRDFGRIIEYFVDEYAAGRTPNPCVRCNDWLKFGKLHEFSQQIGADFVASGHYARVQRDQETEGRNDGTGWRLLRGLDASKDQSYVLFGVPQAQLSRMIFPVGGMPKSRVRELAAEFGLPVFNKPDSQEICFVPDNDYAGLVERRRPEVARLGEIRDEAGRVVGTHHGQHRFTVGQRRGLNLALGYPVYVVGKDVGSNTVTVGRREQLLAGGCVAGEANWLSERPESSREHNVWAKYRYNTPAVRARVRVLPDSHATPGSAELAPTPSGRTGKFEIVFEVQQPAVSPGQAVVLYDADDPEVVKGGGWIQHVHAASGEGDRG